MDRDGLYNREGKGCFAVFIPGTLEDDAVMFSVAKLMLVGAPPASNVLRRPDVNAVADSVADGVDARYVDYSHVVRSIVYVVRGAVSVCSTSGVSQYRALGCLC